MTVFGVPLGPQSDITLEDSPRLGYRREGGWNERGSWGFVLMQAHVTEGISSPADTGSCSKGTAKWTQHIILRYDRIIDVSHSEQQSPFICEEGYIFGCFLWLWYLHKLGSSWAVLDEWSKWVNLGFLQINSEWCQEISKAASADKNSSSQ